MPPLHVLVVARWYPAVDDPARGSFVADQVDALVASGQVTAEVASFEYVRLNRVPERREPERTAIHARYGAAVGRDDAAIPGGWPARVGTWPHLGDVPVARLPVASGPEDTAGREGDDHLAAFLPFVEARVASRPPRRFDLVHAHTGFPDGELAAAAARRLGVPYVMTEHASRTRDLLRDPAVRERYVAVVRGAARVMVVSGSLAAELRDALPELASELADRLVVVPNMVPVERFRAPAAPDRRRGELLYVGTRKPDKGIDTLLSALALARAHDPGLTLRLVGRSPTPAIEAGWLSRAEELGVADAVTFDPPVDRAGVADAMARADLFVHPSRYETFGVVVAEALASGLPVVATRSGGAEEILGPDPSSVGALVPVDDPEAMASAILATLARRAAFDPGHLRARAVERFGAGAVGSQVLAVYRGAVGIDAGADGGPHAATDRRANAAGTSPAVRFPAHALPLVVAFNRVQAARLLAPLPTDLLAALTLVTAEDPGDQPLPAGLGRVIAIDLDAGYQAAVRDARPSQRPRGLVGRVVRFARDPGASDRIAAVHAARPEYRLATARQQVVEAARAARPSAGEDRTDPPDILCLDGYDVLAAESAIDAGVARLAPGGIRWLADRWAAGVRGVPVP